MNLLNKKFLIIFGGLLVLIIAGAGVFWFSGGYDEWLGQREERRQADKAAEVQTRVEEAYRNDTFGGKTPQETLDMFVAALRVGDVELASKYFALDDNLERGKWYEFLLKIKDAGSLDKMVNDIATAIFYKSIYEGKQQFIIYNEDKSDSLIINMAINPILKVWKIESL